MRCGKTRGRAASAASAASSKRRARRSAVSWGASRRWRTWPPSIGSDEKRLNRTIVRINTIESTSPLASADKGDDIDAAGRAGAGRTRAARHRLRACRSSRPRAGAIESLPWRERKVIGLYYYGEVTMKQIGQEIGVNESRVSQLHARAIRRLRDALGNTMAPARSGGDAPLDRAAVHAEAGGHEGAAAGGSRGGASGRGGAALHENVARRAQQVAEPERLCEPAAAALFEKAFRVGADDVAGDEDHALRQRRWRAIAR